MDLSFDIRSLHAAYATGLSPAALLDEVARRIAAAADPGIFLSLLPRPALDRLVAALGPFDPVAKPLWGLPFAIKDNIDLAGLPTTAACPAYAYEPAAGAFAVERLIAVGALPIGKTNLDQFATGLVGLRTPYPPPRNPFDPARIPGGSSSGSAVAVARGLVTFALGTDTAGSGRVPAGLNNLVGLKPSLGAISTRGVVPACRSLDCVSVFALTVDDAWAAATVMAAYDVEEPFSQDRPFGTLAAASAPARLGVPLPGQLDFLGDDLAARAFAATLADAEACGCQFLPVDIAPLLEVARLLYEGPWVAERLAAIRGFFDRQPEALHPTTRAIIGGAAAIGAADAFAGFYRLAALRRAAEPLWTAIDALLVPTYPRPPTVAEATAEPVLRNSELGRYTNFVNLLDLCALAVPGRFRDDGFPSGVTLIAPAGRDAGLARLGRCLQATAGTPLGATGKAAPALEPLREPGRSATAGVDLVVVGAHMSGLPLNGALLALGATFQRQARTRPCYRLYALDTAPPPRPGLLRVAEGGAAIEVEVWRLPSAQVGAFLGTIGAPLGLGTVLLDDGTAPKGFLVEQAGLGEAVDITAFGGWRPYLAAAAA